MMVILFEKKIVKDNNSVGTISGKEITEFLKKKYSIIPFNEEESESLDKVFFCFPDKMNE